MHIRYMYRYCKEPLFGSITESRPAIGNNRWLTTALLGANSWLNGEGEIAMKSELFCCAIAICMASPAHAGFKSWSAETTPDPFTGGIKVVVDYSDTLRSGAFIICDSSQAGLELRVLAGWEYTSMLDGRVADGKIAVDGKVVLSAKGQPGAFGQNIAGVSFPIDADHAAAFVDAMKNARAQIAFQDGISNGPLLLTARGSTKAGKSLDACLAAQASGEPEVMATEEVRADPESEERTGCEDAKDSDAGMLSAGGCYARFLGYVLAAEERCKGYEVVPAATAGGHLTAEDREAVDMRIDIERKEAADVIADMSCFAATRQVLNYTDLPFDKVWMAR